MQTQPLAQPHRLLAFAAEMLTLCEWLLFLIVVFVPLERVCALHRQKIFRKAWGADLLYYFLSGFAPKLLMTLPLTLLAAVVHRLVPVGYYHAMAGIPLWLRLPAAFVVGEVGAYWGHRWSHEIRFLWRFHAIHHSAEEIDFLVNTRAHPVDMFFVRFCGLVPMYVLGLAQAGGNRLDPGPILITVLGTVWGFFIHANIKWRFGWLEWLLASPAFHHWHHTNDGPELIDKNYAAMLPLVDKLFGTLYLPKNQWPVKYGIDAKVPSNVPEQLVRPLLLSD